MAKNKTKKNYLEDLNRDLNNNLYAREKAVKLGRETDSVEDIVAQLTIETLAYKFDEVVFAIDGSTDDEKLLELANLGAKRIGLAWERNMDPVLNGEVETTRTEAIRATLKDIASPTDEETVLASELNRGAEILAQTTESFVEVSDFLESNLLKHAA